MKMNLMTITLKMVLSLSALAAGLSVDSTASFARDDAIYAPPNGKAYSRHLPRIFRHTYGSVAHQEPQYSRFRDIYQSDSLGHQSFPNPDRDFDGPNTNNSL
jgi:hypothetical protein